MFAWILAKWCAGSVVSWHGVVWCGVVVGVVACEERAGVAAVFVLCCLQHHSQQGCPCAGLRPARLGVWLAEPHTGGSKVYCACVFECRHFSSRHWQRLVCRVGWCLQGRLCVGKEALRRCVYVHVTGMMVTEQPSGRYTSSTPNNQDTGQTDDQQALVCMFGVDRVARAALPVCVH